MHRHESVRAAAIAIAAHAGVRGLPAPTAGDDGLQALMDTLDASLEASGGNLDAELSLAHAARGRDLYLVTVSSLPSAHDGARGPRTYDLEVEAFSLAQALKLSLDGLRTHQWVRPRHGGDHGTDGFVTADPSRYAGTGAIRQGTWDDVAPAIREDRAAKRARPLPGAGDPPEVAATGDMAPDVAALVAHGAALGLGGAEATSAAGLRRLLVSLHDYAEARATDLGMELGEARAAREAAPTPAFG